MTAAGEPGRTDTAMPRSHHVATSPLRSRSMTDRPGRAAKAPLKAISKVDSAVVAAAAADPAVLVDLHDDLRLSLGALAKTLDTSYTEHWQVAHLATGYIVLVPADPDAPGLLDPLRVDPRQRIRLTAGVAHRLAVAIGG